MIEPFRNNQACWYTPKWEFRVSQKLLYWNRAILVCTWEKNCSKFELFNYVDI